ncbi:unnamed protein product [Fusarium graminearum]|nr:unnamed protein product [Fusarium graminearum]
MPHSFNMSLDFFGSNTLCSKQGSQSRVLTSHNPGHALHFKGSLRIATFVLTHATLKIVEQLTLTSARTTLVLTIEGERLWGSRLRLDSTSDDGPDELRQISEQ